MWLTELTETAAQKPLKPVSETDELTTTFAPQAEKPQTKQKRSRRNQDRSIRLNAKR
jgi:hypothetical protein